MNSFELNKVLGAILGTSLIVLALKQDINPDYIIPMHCSGAPFVHEIARQMPEKLVTSYVGSRFIFSC